MTRPQISGNRPTLLGDFFDTLQSEVIVTQDNYKTTLASIDSTKQYRIDGIIDMTADPITVEVPVGGWSFRGLNFDVSGIKCSASNFTLAESAVGGSGNILGADCFIQIDGANSRAWNFTDANGFNAFEFSQLNYINCTSLGIITGYRQGLESGTGRFGGTPELTLDGSWIGGYKITTSVAGNLSPSFNGYLFKAGGTLSLNSRFQCDMNINLPALAGFCDFSPSNFANPNTLLPEAMRVTRNGVIDPDDANLTPNVTEKDICSNWYRNVGLKNTFKGGFFKVTTEVATPIAATNTRYPLLGTYTVSNLAHFDSPSQGQARFISDSTFEFEVKAAFKIEGNQNNVINIYVVIDRAVGGTDTIEVFPSVIDNLLGTRDIAIVNIDHPIDMKFNDVLRFEIENESATATLTAEIGSYFQVKER